METGQDAFTTSSKTSYSFVFSIDTKYL